jgi:hypothetical protein
MTIWTVSAIDNEDNFRPVLNICGSYTTRGIALDKCVEWILERFGHVPRLAHAMANNKASVIPGIMFEERNGKVVVAKGCRHKIEDLLRDELGAQGFYCASDGENEYIFCVDENDVEGIVWQTVTWGDSDTEGPEFTTPWPEMFTSEETAVETFIDYVKDLYRSHHMRWSDRFLRETRKSLKDDGKVQVDLNDGTSVSCVLYSCGGENVKE